MNELMFLSETDGAAPAGAAAPAVPSTPAPSGPTEYRVPEGHRLVREDDWSGRESQSKRLAELGLDKDDAYGETKSLLDTLRTRQMTPAQMAQLLSGQKAEPKAQQQQQPAFDADKTKAEIMAELRRENAKADWDSRHSKREEWVNEKVKAIVGDDELLGPILKNHLLQSIDQARFKGGVPEGHPLHGVVSGLYSDDLYKGLDASLAELPAKLAGWKLKQIGAAANGKGAPIATAGGNKASGKDEARGDSGPKPLNQMSRSEREAAAKKHFAPA